MVSCQPQLAGCTGRCNYPLLDMATAPSDGGSTPLLPGNATPQWTGQAKRLPFVGASPLSEYERLETVNEGTYGYVARNKGETAVKTANVTGTGGGALVVVHSQCGVQGARQEDEPSGSHETT